MANQHAANVPSLKMVYAFESRRLLALEPVAQLEKSAGVRSLRPQVRFLPGSFLSRALRENYCGEINRKS